MVGLYRYGNDKDPIALGCRRPSMLVNTDLNRASLASVWHSAADRTRPLSPWISSNGSVYPNRYLHGLLSGPHVTSDVQGNTIACTAPYSSYFA